MKLTDIPAKLPLPFANAGTRRAIPTASQIGIHDGYASLTDGFPPLTFTELAAGGIPPYGADWNGILYEVSAATRWDNAGCAYPYDSTFSTAIGGYPKAAIVLNSTADGFWISRQDDNTDAPGAGSTKWAEFNVNSPNTVATWSALASTPVAYAGQRFTLTEYIASTQKGGGDLVALAGTPTVDDVTTFNSATTGFYFKRINYYSIAPYQAGVLSDGATSDNAALERFAVVSQNARLDGITKTTSSIRTLIDSWYWGEGSLDLIYRKFVTPTLHKNDDFYSQDVVAAKHVKWGCMIAKPVVLLLGDSISTYSANTNDRGDMLVETLRRKLNADFPNGVTFYDRAIGGQAYSTLFTDQHSSGIPWYPTNTVNWITDFVTLLKPDIVIFSFGMNDAGTATITAMKAAIDYLQGLTKPPSIIHCTNMVPRIVSTNCPVGDEKLQMNARDYAAGLYRTYAKFRDIGLIDIHRKYCKTVDGFDPASTVLKQGVSLTLTTSGGNNKYTAASDANECQWEFYFDDSASAAWMTGGTPGTGIVIDFGIAGADNIQLTRSGSTLGVSVFVGGVTLVSTFVPCTFSNSLQYNLTVERKNGYLNIYAAWDPTTNYGGYNEPIFCQKIAYAGGTSVNDTYSPGLLNANFREGIYIKNAPSIRNSLYWNTEGTDQGYGGSGYNHPSHWAGGMVYRPVIDALNFYTYIPRSGHIAVLAGAGSIAVVFASLSEPDELNANYEVLITFRDGNPVATGRVEFRATTGFAYYFTAGTTNNTVMFWTIIR